MRRFYGNTARMLLFGFLVFLISMSGTALGQTYLDSTAAIDARVEDLLSRMTLQEKIGQMTQAERNALSLNSDIKDFFLGSLLSGGGSAPANNSASGWADMYDTYQAEALKTRLGIPLIYGIDAVHGHNNVKGAVIFPHNIGLGATRNPELVKEVSRITALEVAATGIDWTFAPCIAVPRNIRWGRTYEGFGETPELQSMMAGPAVTGLQGDSLNHPRSVLACAKHFIADGGTTDGIDQGNTQIDEETLRSIHLPGYIDAIEAGVGTIMASYSSWNGQKLHGHKYLLTDLLKDELGFKGFVISDWAGIDQLPGDYRSDVKQSINAGVDMVMTPYNYEEFISTLTSLVNSGEVTQERIDDAVRRILYQKFALGLFEQPYTDRSLTSYLGIAPHREVGRQAVRESMVLLAKKDGALPLEKDGRKILVAGRHADNLGFQCGGWSIFWQGGSGNITTGTTILKAIENGAGSSQVVFSEDGSEGTDADVAVVVIGEEPYAEGAGDRDDLSLNKNDVNLVQELYGYGMKVVVVLISGRPMLIDNILPYSDAVLAAWLPGTEGQGVADILFGDFQPTGKLGHTWPRSMEQVPLNLGDTDYDPLFAYDHGLQSAEDDPEGTAPQFYAGAVSQTATFITVAFTRAIDISQSNTSQFVITVNGSAANVTSLALYDDLTLRLDLSASLSAGDIIKLEYNGSGLKSADGATVAPFGPVDIYNLLDENAAATLPGKIEAEDWLDMEGVATENCTDIGGGLNVGWIDAGDWMTYRVSASAAGEYTMKYRVASLSNSGSAAAYADDAFLATTSFPITGGWQTWTTVEQNVTLAAGEQILKIVCIDGGFNINWIEFEALSTTISDPEIVPLSTALMQNYPNPFNPVTEIPLQLSQSQVVEVLVFDQLGNRVATVFKGHLNAGSHTLRFDASELASGIYYYRLKAGAKLQTRKMVLLK